MGKILKTLRHIKFWNVALAVFILSAIPFVFIVELFIFLDYKNEPKVLVKSFIVSAVLACVADVAGYAAAKIRKKFKKKPGWKYINT